MQWEDGAFGEAAGTFNDTVDQVRQAHKAGSVDASRLAKGKLRPFQFPATVDIFAKVVVYLLRKVLPADANLAALTGEDIVKKIASVDMGTVMKDSKSEEIPPEVTKESFEPGTALAVFFEENPRFVMAARHLVAQFRGERAALARLPKSTLADAGPVVAAACGKGGLEVYATYMDHLAGFKLEGYEMRPEVHGADLKKKRAEYSLLGLIGLGVCKGGVSCPNAFPKDGEDSLRAINRMANVDPSTILEKMASEMPDGPLRECSEDAAGRPVADCLKITSGGGLGDAPFGGAEGVYGSEAVISPLREGLGCELVPPGAGAGLERNLEDAFGDAGGNGLFARRQKAEGPVMRDDLDVQKRVPRRLFE